MRLKKIKLAGFKSFVDPTTLELRSNLVAVLGPNGCGKSNIIDAVRWVMGESSAKHLRGESMSDVIFNGSTTRKPVGQAAIELLFDNSDGSLGGEYAAFGEISVRREVTRDGNLSYFLNGTRCRRKDITDIFLGTGLGPRSYAIIEQGMISRLIEAKPDDLRAFFEEAAGISLYKKRRHETEIRMRHTSENLARLQDLRLELDKQLERLKRQSESARKYQDYQTQKIRLEADLAALNWTHLDAELGSKKEILREQAGLIEQRLSERARLDLELEKYRFEHSDKIEEYNQIQAHFFELGTQIARLEQNLQHILERERQLIAEIAQLSEQTSELELQVEMDAAELLDLESKLIDEGDPVDNHDFLREAREQLSRAQETLKSQQMALERVKTESAQIEQAAQVAKANIEFLERQLLERQKRLERLIGEQELIIKDSRQDELALYQAQHDVLEEQNEDLQSAAISHQEKLISAQTQLETLREHSQVVARSLQEKAGRVAALQALQEAANGEDNPVFRQWLEAAGLAQHTRLRAVLNVEAPWTLAVERVLDHALQAFYISGEQALELDWASFNAGQLTLLTDTENAKDASFLDLPLLSQFVQSDWPCETLLSQIYTVSNLEEALEHRAKLKPYQSLITPEGLWLGPNWLKNWQGHASHTGTLARDKELKALELEIKALELEKESAEQSLQTLRFEIQVAQEAYQETQERTKMLQAQLRSSDAQLAAINNSSENARARLTDIAEELSDIRTQQEQTHNDLSLARVSLSDSLEALGAYQDERTVWQLAQEEAYEHVQAAQAQYQELQLSEQQKTLIQKSLTSQKDALSQSLKRSQNQVLQAHNRQEQTQKQLAELLAPQDDYQFELSELLSQRLVEETQVQETRAALEAFEQTARQLERDRARSDKEALELRGSIETVRLEVQALDMHATQALEKITQSPYELELLLSELDREGDIAEWQQHHNELSRKIHNLGAINLAAIEEFEAEQLRKTYIDAQYADLSEALETLENAIKRIDKETRARFKETFDKVNQGFQTLFPKLFGGGQAYLELTGDELLDAGVTVMARPPGKRNSSIHLLSGGEKALTAVSLVFAIFQLNPAPFCILDEVDAPLDDANVSRFCRLVEHMSEQVQFIYVTHNKIAMEMAHHLAGVTMKEPGVSRLVSVDMNEAEALIAS